MSKDPAFLFYSTDFYEATRTMLPEERGIYIDLLIYQHQHEGFIPNDLRRIAMYCSGSDEAMLKAILEAKFKLCDKGWYNLKLQSIIDERKDFSSKQSLNGSVGQFFKKAKAALKVAEYRKIQDFLNQYTNEEKHKIINEYSQKNQANLEAMLKAMLKHLEDEIENEIENEDVINSFKSNLSARDLIIKKWFDYRKEIKKPLKELSIQSLKSTWQSKSDSELTAIIEQSISNGWQGLFEIKQQPQQQSIFESNKPNSVYFDPSPDEAAERRLRSQVNMFTDKVKKDYVLGVEYTEDQLQDYLEKNVKNYKRP